MARMIYYPNEGLAVEGEGEGDAEVGEAVDKIHGSVGKAGVSAGLGMHGGGLNPGGEIGSRGRFTHQSGRR